MPWPLAIVSVVAALLSLLAPVGAFSQADPSPSAKDKGKPVSPPNEARLRYAADHGRRRLTPEGPVIFLDGNVKFTREQMSVTAQRARYYEQGRFAWIVGQVYALTESLQLWADSMRVEEISNVGRAFGHVHLLSSDGVMGKGQRGIFWRDQDRMALVGQARIIDSTFTLEGDSITTVKTISSKPSVRSRSSTPRRRQWSPVSME